MSMDDVLERVLDLEERMDINPNHNPRWIEEEDDFLRENLGKLTEGEIGAEIGRSANAVHMRWTRELRLTAPSKDPDYITTQKIAEALGVENHGPASWVDRGLLPGERIPFDSGRLIRRVKRSAWYQWLRVPEHWVYIKLEKVIDPKVRKILETAQTRWGDEWWTTRQAADYFQDGTIPKDITRQIHLGRLNGIRAINPSGRNPGGRWNYWYVRRSDVEQLVIPRKA